MTEEHYREGMEKPTTAVLHSAFAVLSLRHGTSWGMLALSAGAVNAGAFVWAQRFVTHVTGTVTRLGTEAGSWSTVLESGCLLGSFVLGSMASVLALQGRALRGLRPHHAWPRVPRSRCAPRT